MDYNGIASQMEQLRKRNIPKEVFSSFERSFDVEYAHQSTALEGNTLTLIQTKLIIEDGVSVGGKTLREIYEVVNCDKAFALAKSGVSKGEPLSEVLVKDFHAVLMENIMTGGVYRNCDVSITGASHNPPSPNSMYDQIKYFYSRLSRTDLNPIEYAAWAHAELVRIHPFPDGNGRTARLVMNYCLMSSGFLPVNISVDSKAAYCEALDKYAADGALQPFAELVSELELKRIQSCLAIEF